MKGKLKMLKTKNIPMDEVALHEQRVEELFAEAALHEEMIENTIEDLKNTNVAIAEEHDVIIAIQKRCEVALGELDKLKKENDEKIDALLEIFSKK
jgi:hypothetical protein